MAYWEDGCGIQLCMSASMNVGNGGVYLNSWHFITHIFKTEKVVFLVKIHRKYSSSLKYLLLVF